MKSILIKYLIRFSLLLENVIRRNRVKKYIKNGELIIGRHTYGYNNIEINQYHGSYAKVKIGSFCSIGPELKLICGGIHPTKWMSTYPFRIQWNLNGKYEDGMPYSNGDISIGNDVWIGTNVTILSGVKVGHGAVLATGSIVTKDVPDYAIVGGNPAKTIKYRFSENKISRLLELKWWDLNDNELREKINDLQSEY